MGGAGDLDRLISVERANPGQDATGGVTAGGFSLVGVVWAKRQDLSASEAFKADEKAATRISLFKVYSSSVTRGVTPKDRINDHGDIYEITGIKETNDGRNRYLELTAILRNDGT